MRDLRGPPPQGPAGEANLCAQVETGDAWNGEGRTIRGCGYLDIWTWSTSPRHVSVTLEMLPLMRRVFWTHKNNAPGEVHSRRASG